MNDRSVSAATEAAEECGCAPTPAERDSFWKLSVTRRGAFGLGALGVAAFAAFGIGSGVSAAYAASYPSWDDVQRAKNNEAAKAAEITRIEGLIESLTQKVAETQAAADTASDEFYAAQQEYFAAITEAESLQAQADDNQRLPKLLRAGRAKSRHSSTATVETIQHFNCSSPVPRTMPMSCCPVWAPWTSCSSTTNRSTMTLFRHATPPNR